MQINENEARDDETREILDYYRGLPERSSQEAIVEMLRELQPLYAGAGSGGCRGTGLHGAGHM